MAKTVRRTQKTSPAVLDGIDAHRNTVRTMGGFFAIALSIAVLIVGLLLLVFVRYFLSLISSLFLWWVIGHYAARRAIQSTISSWPEWLREFRPLAIGVVLGSIISLALAAAVLGVI
jgi:hypothetical protein